MLVVVVPDWGGGCVEGCLCGGGNGAEFIGGAPLPGAALGGREAEVGLCCVVGAGLARGREGDDTGREVGCDCGRTPLGGGPPFCTGGFGSGGLG